MRTPRVVVPAAACGEVLELSPGDARHVARVLRRQVGDELVLLAGSDRYRALVEELEPLGDEVRVVVRPVERLEEAVPAIPWTVAVGLVKGAAMDGAVRLASELGLESLVPLVCERSQVRADRSGRMARWERIAAEAAKQCGRAEPLRVGAPAGIREVLEQTAAERRYIAQPGAAGSVAELLGERSGLVPALFLVGPEGGFSPAEVEAAVGAGARAIGFPTPVLRTPTGVLLIAALGVLLRGLGGPGGASAPGSARRAPGQSC